MQVSKYLNPLENSVFQFSIYDFHLSKNKFNKTCFGGVNRV